MDVEVGPNETLAAARVGGFDETLLGAWRGRVLEAPDKVQVHSDELTVSRRDLDDRATRLWSAWAEAGLNRGDRVAVQLQNSLEMVEVVLAAWLGGAVVVPVNPMYRQRELEHVLGDSGSAFFVFDAENGAVARSAADAAGVSVVYDDADIAAMCAPDPSEERVEREGDVTIQVDAGSPALITYTSGTTGPSKGAVASHANLMAGAQVYRDAAGVDASSVVLAVAPMCHITGLVGHLAASVLTGAELVLMGRFDADRALELIERHEVTFTIGALTAYRALLDAADRTPRDVSSVRTLYSGGAPVAPAVAADVERVFGVPLGNAYGLTESTSISHLTPRGRRGPVDPITGALSIGRPAPGTSAWIVDEAGQRVLDGQPGELVIEGPGVVAGYWRHQEATAETFVDGALRTGDVATTDSDGWFYLIDRIKDQINASGYKVWPREVEDVLYEHPAVAEAAVFGVDDDYRGETVVAAVVLRPGIEASADDLIAFTRQRLAPYKCPRRIRLLPDLPVTSSGKILRRELRLKEESDV